MSSPERTRMRTIDGIEVEQVPTCWSEVEVIVSKAMTYGMKLGEHRAADLLRFTAFRGKKDWEHSGVKQYEATIQAAKIIESDMKQIDRDFTSTMQYAFEKRGVTISCD